MIFGPFLIVRILQQCAILILRCLFIVLHVLLCKHQEDAAMNIGRNILYFRQQQGMTQQQLTDALGIATWKINRKSRNAYVNSAVGEHLTAVIASALLIFLILILI